uniref:Hint domain-containing protein n=1 Tax=Panagrolaimus sp. PS1159 TaxID=55785 RepID=A0AC35GSL8_9BILA
MAKFLNVYNIKKGGMVKGGEIKMNGNVTTGFLYISNIVKVVNNDLSVSYKVFVNELSCKKPRYRIYAAKHYQSDGYRVDGYQEYENEAPYVDPVNEYAPAPIKSSRFSALQHKKNEIVENPYGQEEEEEEEEEEVEEVEEVETTTQEEELYDDEKEEEGEDDDHEASFGGSDCMSAGEIDSETGGESPAQSNAQTLGGGNPSASAPGTGAGAGAGAGACFSGDTYVRTANGETKRMDELKIGEWVISPGDGKMGISKVVSWLHRMPELEMEFLKITLENGKTLKITRKHYIYKTDCSIKQTQKLSYESVEAENLQISDCLLLLNQKQLLIRSRITKIEIIKEKGIYAPLTENGNIIVNEIFASCFSDIDNQSILFTFSNINNFFKNVVAEIFFLFFDSFFQNRKNYEIEIIPGIQNVIQIAKSVL